MPQQVNTNLSETVNVLREQYGLPAVGAAYITSSSIKDVVVGVRKTGTTDSVVSTDRFHIGSCGKSITSTLIGILVDEGKLSWTTRPIDVFPEMAAKINPGYKQITLEQILTHHAGLIALQNPEILATVPKQRHAFAEWVLEQPPAKTPGTFLYSNAGYCVAAAMAEQVTGQSWETLLTTRIFQPLGITPTFGWPAVSDPNQPWGHQEINGKLVPHDPNNPEETMPAVLAPAGDISMSIRDFATYVQMHLRGLRSRKSLVPSSIITKLHASKDGHAMGWEVQDLNGTQVHWHGGCNGTFYAIMLIKPDEDKAAVVVTNSVPVTGSTSEKAFLGMVDQMLQKIR
ncbi:MAG: serine hydrolase domain-containing protein [Armatimonadota bacterium]